MLSVKYCPHPSDDWETFLVQKKVTDQYFSHLVRMVPRVDVDYDDWETFLVQKKVTDQYSSHLVRMVPRVDVDTDRSAATGCYVTERGSFLRRY